MVELDEIIFNIKNIFGENIEYLLNQIYNNLKEIDRREYKDENTLKSLIEKIGHAIEEIQNIFFIFTEKNDNFYNINHNVEEEINKLKYIYTKYKKEYKKNKNKDNQNNKNTQIINNNKHNQKIDSFEFGIKNQNIKAEFYKTSLLFNNNGEEDYLEYYLEESQILRKNWHEICYVYDEYDIYDIYYDIKAVGLRDNHFFTSTSHSFHYNTIVEIELLLLNNIPIQYIQRNHRVEFKIKLYNLQTAKIHIIYKEFKDLSKYSQGEIEERKIYRSEYYGLHRSLAGQMAKFCLILKGSFDIVNFKDYFLIRNEKNKNEIEYVWGGRVPYEGKRTLIMFSKSEALWSFKFTSKFHSNQNIKNTIFKIPIEFIGGNNEILNIKTSSPQTSNIILDEENREYIIKYKNTKYNKGEFIIQGELQNKCSGEWFVDLSDDIIEKKMPKEDILCKPQLYKIATEIIKDYDKNNKNNDFKFLDYMKIGMWVHKNIKYDYNYTGRTEFSAVDIYKMKIGVCHHFTKLSNALLYSLGYKVLYVSGYTCKK